MKVLAVSLVVVVLLIYIGCSIYLYFAQRSFLYFPTAEVHNVQADDLRVKSDGATLQIWRLSGDSRKAILYFGGNGEDVALNIPDFARLFPAYTVYLLNYRGYGASTGTPTEQALYHDAQVIYDVIRPHHTTIAIIGRSLGTAVATYLAAHRLVERLVLVTPFDSIVRVAQSAFPIFPVALLLRDRYDSRSRAASIKVPTLILIAERDDVIPRRNSQTLAAALNPSLVTVIVIRGATHNTISSFPQYVEALAAFF